MQWRAGCAAPFLPTAYSLQSTALPSSGTLYVVATPIGNLGDLSPRAREVLAGVAVIAAEDTRHTRQLLQSCGVATPLTSLHEHNEAQKSGELIERLRAGESIALVSDAGTPLISDPGFDLVGAARAAGVNIVAVPGACALIAALSIAGLPTDRFAYEGFLPAKGGPRRQRLESLASESRTLVFYEAPHRLRELLADLASVFGGERRAVVSREITKRFETTYAGSLQSLQERAEQDPDMSRGELVVVVGGREGEPQGSIQLDPEQVLRTLLEDLSPSQAAKTAAKLTGAKRAELYEAAVRIVGRRGGEESE
jgi:16S rRNA (cytidine1402-2'-O)-methyltransferase